ncbi:MAG: hypothetical protein NC081_02140 [Roseburia sp.]|nr:hypothetical protein [Roseburia sp.]
MKRIEFLRQILVTQFNHWSFFTLALGALLLGMHFSQEQPLRGTDFLCWGILGLMPLIQYYIRIFIRKLWAVLGLHILLLALGLLIPAGHMSMQIIVTLCSLGYLINSMVRRFSERRRKEGMLPLPFAICSGGGVLFFLHAMGDTGYEQYYVVLLISLTSMYFIGSYLERYLQFLQADKNSAGYLPEREIFYAGLKTVLLYTGGGVLVLIAVSNLTVLNQAAEWLKKCLLELIRYLLHFFVKEQEAIEEVERQVIEGNPAMMAPTDAAEPFWLWQILEKLLFIITFIILAILLIKAAVGFIRFIRARLNGSVCEKNAAIEKKKDVREQLPLSPGIRRRKLPGTLTVAERIRRQFRRRLLADRKWLDTPSRYTAREYALLSGRTAAAELYEKARYSDIVCSKEDLKHMKEACK